jgi:hypothetical protein
MKIFADEIMKTKLISGRAWTDTMYAGMAQKYRIMKYA